MPIYAYRCDACGFAKDVLQKMSDDPLTVCPECQQANFKKQVTAAGFQLKGSGWYVTDFRGGAGNANSTGAATGVSASNDDAGKDKGSGATTTAATESAPASTTSVAPATGSDQAA